MKFVVCEHVYSEQKETLATNSSILSCISEVAFLIFKII